MTSPVPPAAFAAALAALPAAGPKRLVALLRAWPPEGAWRQVVAGRAHQHSEVGAACVPHPDRIGRLWSKAAAAHDPGRFWAAYQRLGVAVHVLGDASYPDELAGDHEAPAVLFAQGDLGALARPRAAIVGTRRCTHYGREVAYELGRALAEQGVAVVSGLAAGVDAAGHRGALAGAGAAPVAVVGSGHDIVYPAANTELWRRVAAEGLLLSEAPLGARPEAWRFPARNRIIAALADVVVVVESHRAGGSRHTVEAANDRGRRVMAVPGPIRSPASAGTNQLLSEGCGPVTDADDVLAALSLDTAGSSRHDLRPPPDDGDLTVLEAVGWEASMLEQVLGRTGLPPPQALLALSRLEAAGWVTGAGGWWQRVGVPQH